jgi:hypothetical protein
MVASLLKKIYYFGGRISDGEAGMGRQFNGEAVDSSQPTETVIPHPTTLYQRNASVNWAVVKMAASPARTPTNAPVEVHRFTKNASTNTPSIPP